MKKILLLAPLLFSGCWLFPDAVHPPKIKTLKVIDKIQVTDGCICGNELLKVHGLRTSETYYFNEVTRYNQEFTK